MSEQQLGLPQEVNFNLALPKYLRPARKVHVRAQPYNGTTFRGANTSIKVKLPSSARTFMIPASKYVKFTVDHLPTATAPTGTDVGTDASYLIGDGKSYFKNINIGQNNGIAVDALAEVNVFSHIMKKLTMNEAETKGKALYMGGATGISHIASNVGLVINHSANTGFTNMKVSFCEPLYSALTNVSTLLPMWGKELEYEFQLEDVANIIRNRNPLRGIAGFEISNLELVVECLEFEEASFNYLMEQNGNPSVMVLKSETYSYSSSAISGGGRKDIIFPFNCSSLKAFLWNAWTSNTGTDTNGTQGIGGTHEGKFGGINPNLNTFQLVLHSTPYPNLPIRYDDAPAEVATYNAKALGSLYSTNHTGSIRPTAFRKALDANYANNSLWLGQYTTLQSTGTTPAFSTETFNAGTEIANQLRSNMMYNILDLEKISHSKDNLYAGVKASEGLIQYDIKTALASAVNVNFFAIMDCLVQFDNVSGSYYVVR